MFFILSKALLFLLSPFFWLIVTLGAALFLKPSERRKRMKWYALGIFLFFSNTHIFSEFCRTWEIPGKKIENVGNYDVGIVLGGMFEYNDDLDALSIRRQGDRLIQAVTLYKTGKVKKLLITGDSGYVSERGLHEAKQVKKLLVSWGIPEEDILTEESSINTYENAVETVKVLKKHKEIKSYILITSGIHMRRALACFASAGIKCESFSTDLYTNQTGDYHWDQNIIPNVDNFTTWNKLFKEIVGYIVYDVKGYL
ncbi:MAG: YdcF family protein [Crocinitomicaceae bacterium]|nr:YdcF family protein [Crocinitomicaceae bacterium]MDG1658106.1 YdcF family protein [Crocinitomicaceae bacterium]MDG2440190.1 YdcF family protein [Crocinitomicaceae bacterium]